MTSEADCREAATADLPRLAALEAAAFADPWSADMLTGELESPGSLVLVADAGGIPGMGGMGGDHETRDAGLPALLGYACFRQGGGEAELLRVAVEPAARGRGLARRLIAAGLERLRAAGVVSCHLEVRPGNASALAVYHALGFVAAGRRRVYYRDGADALVLRRDL